jgi:Carbohydrate-binding family 9
MRRVSPTTLANHSAIHSNRANRFARGVMLVVVLACDCVAWGQESADSPRVDPPSVRVSPCVDFTLTGKGDAAAWDKSRWIGMNRRAGPRDYRTRFKILYSPKGIYVLLDGADTSLTATVTEDFQDLWKEDVFECFFWTDENHPIYFEYEISPLGRELPILIPNLEGRFLGWRPWHYEGNRRTRTAVTVQGGPQKSGAVVTGWRAEVFVPYELLKPLGNVPPVSGTKWRANFYRMDYDDENTTSWDWARVGPSFHEFQRFGTLVFE